LGVEKFVAFGLFEVQLDALIDLFELPPFLRRMHLDVCSAVFFFLRSIFLVGSLWLGDLCACAPIFVVFRDCHLVKFHFVGMALARCAK
jgi:hypothetical protein